MQIPARYRCVMGVHVGPGRPSLPVPPVDTQHALHAAQASLQLLRLLSMLSLEAATDASVTQPDPWRVELALPGRAVPLRFTQGPLQRGARQHRFNAGHDGQGAMARRKVAWLRMPTLPRCCCAKLRRRSAVVRWCTCPGVVMPCSKVHARGAHDTGRTGTSGRCCRAAPRRGR